MNLDPAKLLFDPNLRLIHIDKHRVSVFHFFIYYLVFCIIFLCISDAWFEIFIISYGINESFRECYMKGRLQI